MIGDGPLTTAELAQYRPNAFLSAQIDAHRKRLDIDREDFRVIDWGCGRGLLVLWLRERGYNALGVDVDPRPIADGAELFRNRGHSPEDCLLELEPNGAAPFPDASVHFTTSFQTLEHLRDLDRTVVELSRVTAPGGEGLHIFPPHRRPVEPHLRMPLVHWLPEGRARRSWIAACVRLGVEPRWFPDGDMDVEEKIETYYRFSVDDTFYRRPEAIVACFEAAGFAADFRIVLESRRRSLLGPWPRLATAWHVHLARDIGLVTVRR